MNTSATGGYLQSQPHFPELPNDFSLTQFIQTALTGISGLSGDLVRPKWQKNPPKQPDIDVNWMAFALVQNKSDTNAYTTLNPDGSYNLQRMEDLEVQCAFFGEDAADVAAATRDGFQIAQNLEALQFAKMGFVNTNQMVHVPDLVNERWVDRYEMSVFLRREILRVYPILTFASFRGFIETIVNGDLKTIACKT